MKHSTDRILTTHVGSLARPHPLLEIMRSKVAGQDYNRAEFARQTREAVKDVVQQQAAAGIDIVSDGEQSKVSFLGYVSDRFSGLEVDSVGVPERQVWKEELEEFGEYYAEYLGGKAQTMVRNPPLLCTGPITYTGHAVLQTDIDNLKAAMSTVGVEEGFMPALGPRIAGRNEYYKTGDEFLEAIARAMHEEYAAIVAAGLIVQIDDPWLTMLYHEDPYGISPRTAHRDDQPVPRGHPGGPRALSHVLRHQRGPARARRPAAGPGAHAAADSSGCDFLRGGQSAPPARVARLGERQAARRTSC